MDKNASKALLSQLYMMDHKEKKKKQKNEKKKNDTSKHTRQFIQRKIKFTIAVFEDLGLFAIPIEILFFYRSEEKEKYTQSFLIFLKNFSFSRKSSKI